MSSQAGGRGTVLRGRSRECATLADLVSRARSGTGQALVLRGEAGVGKTALLEYVSGAAADFRIVQVAGVQTDMELAFAGLQQLCAPLMRHADGLAAPQRQALAVAFGYGTGPAPDRFLVGLAVLGLLAAAADDQPLLCVVDDAQWLDQASVQTLAFVARRLLAERIAMVFAIREGHAELLPGLPELLVTGLSDADARALLESVMIGGIDPRVRDRIVAETRGLPLALVDVPRTVTATELAGGFWIAGKRSSTAAIEAGFVRRITALPAQTQRLLLVAAAEPVGDSALFLRAAAALGIPVDALAPAEEAGVIEFGHRMRFHHPLMRSAAYRAADLADRRMVHRALAEATDPQADPDRRAWHAANAATCPDDAIAAELEASAGRAQCRGGIAAAAAFLERAAILTLDPSLRGARAISAADAKREAAAPEAAYELLALAESGPLSALQRVLVARMRAQMDFVRSRATSTGAPPVGAAAAQLLEAAHGLTDLDDELARETYLEALTAAIYAGRLGEPGLLVEVASAGRAAADAVAPLQRPIDYLLRGMATRILDGPGTGSADLSAALELWNAHAQEQAGQWLYWPFPVAQESAAHEMWDDELLERIAGDTVRRAREAGALAALPPALGYRAGVHFYRGEFDSATRLIEESKAITASMGNAPVRYHTLLLAAWRGAAAEAEAIIEAAAADGAARGEGRLLGLSGFSMAVLYNGLGRYQEALAAAHRCCEYEDLGFYGWCLYELIEAAVHTGDRAAAAAALPKLAERAGASGTDWGLGAAAAAQALLADNDGAEGAFVEAIERLERADIALHLSRARLSYGEWLRRANRRADARKQLTAAHELFTEMGAHGFAERARRELSISGDKVRTQRVGSGDELTAQEAQIARLARDGLTNNEIGAQLFISTHTVEWHLRKVFVKLGITSRKQLRTLSSAPGQAG
ncbi:regulatory protein LuxR [Mycolicibacterium canariasense]|uniref:Regulatory protein LuxR n=1 Tax=Mycolicibacterium canariasense TaxID=228230 RepID=A0A100WEB1_MYCCR|nr:LuxR family transcriptional regulator [Mycolicibacterium canariasense]MCV7209935.1 AAA family ATPase [Mycolicibacterium canariasense]ORV05205.1 LuxR family transcriptional regulator [Mycolicibacterium canariasense]GAS96384.1 regulatory protein LuxR [Mycolicibacterium canariasense]